MLLAIPHDTSRAGTAAIYICIILLHIPYPKMNATACHLLLENLSTLLYTLETAIIDKCGTLECWSRAPSRLQFVRKENETVYILALFNGTKQ